MNKDSAVVVNAAHVILRRLAQVPDTPAVQELRARALSCVREVDAQGGPPTVEKREALMKKVLALHGEARKIGA